MVKSKYENALVHDTSITVDISFLESSGCLFFNATEIAKPFGKRPDDFWKQEQNRSYLAALITLSAGNKTLGDFIVTRRGRGHAGTWFHNDLALQFARWLSVEFAVRLDCWVKQRIGDEQKRSMSRADTKTGFRPLTDAVLAAHPTPKPYHFSNECDMLNGIVLGMSARKFRELHEIQSVRDAMSAEQLADVAHLQMVDAGLLAIGMDFSERKAHLSRIHAQRSGWPLLAA